METKQELRKIYRQKRDEILPEIRKKASRQIAERLWKAEWYKSRSILVYDAIKSEVDLSLFCDEAWKAGKALFFPRTMGKEMEFYRITDRKQLEKGAFSVMEPAVGTYELQKYNREEEAVMLLPGVVFSREGNRIGYGAGYYDRYLEKHTNLYTVGVCFSKQLAEFVPEQNDCPMEEIVTETERIRCRTK